MLSLISIYDSWNALWTLYAGGVLWNRNSAPKSSVKSVWSVREKTPCVREKTPQQLAWVLSYREDAFFFSQKSTDEQNTQHSTETLSQPISQNLTAIFSWNVLWYLYAGGVLWDRNVGWKGSVRSVSSVREKDLYEECKQSSRGNLTYYLLIWNKSSERWKILTTHQPDHPQTTQLSSPTIEDITLK